MLQRILKPSESRAKATWDLRFSQEQSARGEQGSGLISLNPRKKAKCRRENFVSSTGLVKTQKQKTSSPSNFAESNGLSMQQRSPSSLDIEIADTEEEGTQNITFIESKLTSDAKTQAVSIFQRKQILRPATTSKRCEMRLSCDLDENFS